MATSAEIARIRDMISEPDESNGWTDTRIGDLIEASRELDGTPDYPETAANAWGEKASYLAGLVDVAESGSSRRMSQAFDHALAMSKLYGAQVSSTATSEATLTSGRIVRPNRG